MGMANAIALFMLAKEEGTKSATIQEFKEDRAFVGKSLGRNFKKSADIVAIDQGNEKEKELVCALCTSKERH